VADTAEIQGVNSRSELADVGRHLRMQKNAALMASGVTLEDPGTAYIDADVQIGADTVVKPGVTIEAGSVVGSNCTIHSGVRITRCTIQDGVTVLDHCVLTDSVVGAGASVGPFAHLRGETHVAQRAKIGNFVELKKTVLGEGSKASHLAYLGDAVIGTGVNIGAGTNHLQLRRRPEAGDHDRRRGFHRQRHAAHCSCHRWRGCVRRHRHDNPRGRAARCARGERGKAAKYRRLGREEAEA
jgi:bifunctional N-acetylglucosamine-1-phosphate-uridyltransferase/glucosamine-1-phosphate-acetyltransferase GlmU-like protein